MAVSNFCGTGTLKFNDALDVLLSEEAHRKLSGLAETSGSVLSVNQRGRSANRDKKKEWEIQIQIRERYFQVEGWGMLIVQ